MLLISYSFFRFHFRRLLRAQPILFSVTIGTLLACAIVSLVLLNLWITQAAMEKQLHEAIEKTQQFQREKKLSFLATVAPLDLPPFEGAKLVRNLNELAVESLLKLDEVSYVLEDNSNQPFLRYRITFTVLSRYLVIKRLMQKFQTRAPHILLDNISCTRDDIGVNDVSCDLVFSAYFKKP